MEEWAGHERSRDLDVAEAYEQYVGRWSRPVAESFVNWLDVPAGRRWLDVGCGTGALATVVLQAEAEMRDHGTVAVRSALEQAELLVSQGAAATVAARAFFRLCAAVPPLRRRAFASGWAVPAAPRAWERSPVPTAA